MDSQKKVAIVTGSSAGVGRATAVRLADHGCHVVVNYRKGRAEAEETAALCRAAGAEVCVVEADVARDEDCRRLVDTAVHSFGRLDYLVNNAGTTQFIPFEELERLSEEVWEKIFRTNVFGTFYGIRAAVPHLKRSGSGSIVNVTSIAGIQGTGSSIAYAASKAAVNNMTLALARTLGPEIRVNAVAPGAIDTRWIRNGIGESGYGALEKMYRESAPLREIVPAEAVAETIVWLLEGARMTTGEVITVDSGIHLGPAPPLKRRD